MSARVLTGAVVLFVLLLVPTVARAQATGSTRYAVLIQGASGEPQFATQHRGWLESLASTLRDRFGFETSRIVRLTERPVEGEGRASADVVKAELAKLASTTSTDIVFVCLIGHGTGEGSAAKFNLVGPDLSVAEWAALLAPIKARVVFVNTASVSFPFVEGLTGERRIVISATNIPAQRFATMFAESFIQALNADAADLDKNSRLSMWEVFTYASRLQKQHFEQKGLLSTERAVLEDNGDGKGRDAGAATGDDGTLSTMTYLDAKVEARPTDPTLQMLLQRQELLTEEIDALRKKKASMPEAEYEAAFEKLMVQMATLGAEIRKKGGGH
jgi:hypothetical protein